MTYFHMDAKALVWFEVDEDIELFASWDAFVQALQVKFGSIAYDNLLKATIKKLPVLVSNPVLIGVRQTHVSPNGSIHVIKNENVNVPHIHVGAKSRCLVTITKPRN